MIVESTSSGPGETVEAAKPTSAVAALVVPPASIEECQRIIVSFRRVALLLATADFSTESRGQRREAGRALVALAEQAGEADLRSILSIDDPAGNVAVTWTVACYQLGDISPSELRDFPSAVDAVKLLQRCQSPAHMAAELLVSTPSGLCWTAMIRAGTEVEFQPLDAATAGGANDAAVADAVAGWERRLHEWAKDITAGIYGVPATSPSPASMPYSPPLTAQPYLSPPTSALPARPVVPSGERLVAVDPVVVAEMGVALRQLVEAMRMLNAGVSSHDGAVTEMLGRLEEMEDRVVELQQRVAELAESCAGGRPSRRWRRRRSSDI